ncbi:MAG TPA: acetylxylan esterase [Kiritimatiellia bacterium]|nr:acetylxylan esterase [Kiritimatiellia bacterium]
MMNPILISVAVFSACAALATQDISRELMKHVAAYDEAADAAVAAIRTPEALAAKQKEWRAAWLESLGGLPEQTPLEDRTTGVIQCEGYRIEKVVFQSQPGVYVTGLLYLPADPKFKAPYPGVLIVHGHSNEGKLRDGYRRMAILAVKAGFGVFAPDPLSQGERRQCAAKYDTQENCSAEHASLGARAWLVGWNFARFRLWDALRSIDYMASRTELDLSKLAVAGNSGGGTMSVYLQAFDERVKVACPNCYVSSLREVIRERGCHDSEQFFHGQLKSGFNHAALVALGQPRVDLLIGARHADYFPIAGVRSTFGILQGLHDRLGASNDVGLYSCDGPHGWAESSRQAALDWLLYHVKGEATPHCGKKDGKLVLDVEGLRKVTGDFEYGATELPFPMEKGLVTKTGQVRDLPGFKSVYALVAEEADRLAKIRAASKRDFREIVRRRAGIRPLAELPPEDETTFNHAFTWWYLNGREGRLAENHAAILATLGRSRIGVKAEALIRKTAADVKANGGNPVPLVAKGADCIAAAHAYAAEPQLFSSIRLVEAPPSWTDMLMNPDPQQDSYATAVWGALKEYDWTELVPPETLPAADVTRTSDGETLPGQGVERLADGAINPTCAWRWQKKPITVEFDFGEEREIGGVRIMAGRSWVNCGVKAASFFAVPRFGEAGALTTPLAERVEFRPSHTYKENVATWKPVTCRRVRMVIEDTYDFKPNYYSGYTHTATPLLPKFFETPPYPEFSGKTPTVQIAEMSFFGADLPDDLPLPNKDGTEAFPASRLVRDWMYQSCAVSNISHCANVDPDTTQPDPMGQDVSFVMRATDNGRDPEWRGERAAKRKAFLAQFRKEFTQFVYVKHIVMGNSIMHATDDLSDASYQEWKGVPDYRFGSSQLILATIASDGSVSQEVLLDEPDGMIRDPSLSFDAKTLVFAKRRSLEKDDYHLWTLDLETRAQRQLTFNGAVKKEDVKGQTADFEMPCSDIEPCWLPDGSIVFQSTRCGHSVDCWPLPVSNLFRCDADGKNIRRIGFDQVQTFYPQLMDDGRVCYTRWEYNDRSASGLQQLYAMNPDGTKQTGLFANNSEFPFSLMHTRGIPGTSDIMMLSCGHHVGQKGRLALTRLAEADDYANSTYDPAKSVWNMDTNPVVMHFPGNRKMTIPWSPWDNPCGPAVTNMPGMYYVAGAAMDASPGVQPVKMPHDYHYNVFDMHTQFGPQWAYPFPLGCGRFLVSFMPEGCRYYRGPYSSRFGVYAMDETGRRELLAFDWGQHCMQPLPVKRRTPPPRLVPKIDFAQGFGTYYVQNVYEGAAMAGAPTGCVKKLRVIGLEYRPVHIGWNWQFGWHSTQGKIGTPIAVGNAAYDVKHVLGEADVEADGSCSFRAPARTPLYFQLIDQEGCCIQTMRSWSTLQPGEINGCVGCHEHPHRAGVEYAKALALRRPPQALKPPLPGGGAHPLLAALEQEGPLANLDNWMGLNRTKAVEDTDRNDGFSFTRLIQPILDAKCVACHNGSGDKAPAAMDLRGTRGQLPPSDDQSKRKYTTSYLALTYKGQCNEKINFAHGLGFAPFKPPYSFGAARSSVWRMLAQGHHEVQLTDAELRTLACWIDLAVPFCGSYVERHDWNDWYRQRYEYACNKRAAFAWLELNDVRKGLGLPPVPLTGFIPDVAEPRRQKYWSE